MSSSPSPNEALRLAQLELRRVRAEWRASEGARRESEEFKTRLIEGSQDCIKVLDLEGRLLSMNAGGMKTLEICDFSSVHGSMWAEFWQGEHRQACEAALAAARQGKVGRFVGFFPTAQTHKPMWFDVVVNAILRPDGQPERLLAVSRDVTDWKRSEELLRAIIEGTAGVGGRAFFRSLVQHLAEGLHVRWVFVAECLPSLRARSLAFWSDGQAGTDFEYDLRGTPCLEVSLGRTCHVENDLPTVFPEDKGMIDMGTVSYLGVPLSDSAKRTIGHLVIFDDKPMPADPLMLSVMETFAARAGVELEREQAAGDLSRALERQRTLLEINNAIISHLRQEDLLRATCAALRRVMPFDRAAFTLYDPAQDGLRILAVEGDFTSDYFQVGKFIPRRDSHSGWAFDHQRPLLRRDLEQEREYATERVLYEEGVRSICTAPLIVGGESIGTMNLASSTARQYSEAHAELLQEVANQVALAVANMRAYEEINALKARLQAENVYLQEEIRAEHNFTEIVGQSSALREVLRQVDQVAPADSTALVMGETGTGKELIARAIHDRSPRQSRPLVKVNCGAISAGLVESELFGHVKGAFTGALTHRDGRFRLADGGTIFLDEVGELPLDTQVKLLRVLQEQEFEPVGSSSTVRVNVRIIAATNRDLGAAVAAGQFRRDLFYRLNVFPIQVPALRERLADLPLLVSFFLERFARKLGKPTKRVPDSVLRRLADYNWPGNIRELQNVIERAILLSASDTLELAADFAPALPSPVAVAAPPLPLRPADGPPVPSGAMPGAATEAGPARQVRPSGPAPLDPAGDALEDVERRHIESVLTQTGWRIEGEGGAAAILKLNPSTLRSRLQKLGVQRPGKRS